MPSYKITAISILVSTLTISIYASETRSATGDLPPPAGFANQAEEYQLMTGRWCGRLSDGPKIRITVETVTDDGAASGIYEFGKFKVQTKFKGEVKDHKLHTTLPGTSGQGGKWLDADMATWLHKKDRMAGTWESNKSKKSNPAQLGIVTFKAKRCN